MQSPLRTPTPVSASVREQAEAALAKVLLAERRGVDAVLPLASSLRSSCRSTSPTRQKSTLDVPTKRSTTPVFNIMAASKGLPQVWTDKQPRSVSPTRPPEATPPTRPSPAMVWSAPSSTASRISPSRAARNRRLSPPPPPPALALEDVDRRTSPHRMKAASLPKPLPTSPTSLLRKVSTPAASEAAMERALLRAATSPIRTVATPPPPPLPVPPTDGPSTLIQPRNTSPRRSPSPSMEPVLLSDSPAAESKGVWRGDSRGVFSTDSLQRRATAAPPTPLPAVSPLPAAVPLPLPLPAVSPLPVPPAVSPPPPAHLPFDTTSALAALAHLSGAFSRSLTPQRGNSPPGEALCNPCSFASGVTGCPLVNLQGDDMSALADALAGNEPDDEIPPVPFAAVEEAPETGAEKSMQRAFVKLAKILGCHMPSEPTVAASDSSPPSLGFSKSPGVHDDAAIEELARALLSQAQLSQGKPSAVPTSKEAAAFVDEMLSTRAADRSAPVHVESRPRGDSFSPSGFVSYPSAAQEQSALEIMQSARMNADRGPHTSLR